METCPWHGSCLTIHIVFMAGQLWLVMSMTQGLLACKLAIQYCLFFVLTSSFVIKVYGFIFFTAFKSS